MTACTRWGRPGIGNNPPQEDRRRFGTSKYQVFGSSPLVVGESFRALAT